MSAPDWATIQLDEVSTPISEEAPCGESLRYEGTYDRVNEARKADATHLPRGVWERSLKVSDWKLADQICVEALKTKTKDLQIAMWLTEAWIHRFGMTGLRYGLEVCLTLCRSFWDDLHPQIRDGDLDYRIAPFVWLNEHLTTTVRATPLTAPKDPDIPVCSSLEWDTVLRLEKMADLQPEAYEHAKEGKVTRDIFHESTSDTPREWLFALLDELEAAQQVLMELDDYLDEKCGYDGPSLGRLKEVLANALHVMADFVLPAVGIIRPSAQTGEPLDDDAGFDPDAESTDDMVSDTEPAVTEVAPVGPFRIRGREHAYEMLSEIADYLSRVEPHSPTPYLVRRAVSWGDKSLIELLEEFVSDPNELHAVYSLLGLGPRS